MDLLISEATCTWQKSNHLNYRLYRCQGNQQGTCEPPLGTGKARSWHARSHSPLGFYLPFVRIECKEKAGRVEGTDGATHENIGRDDPAHIEVCKGKALEHIHGATCEFTEEEHSSVTQDRICLCFCTVTRAMTTEYSQC